MRIVHASVSLHSHAELVHHSEGSTSSCENTLIEVAIAHCRSDQINAQSVLNQQEYSAQILALDVAYRPYGYGHVIIHMVLMAGTTCASHTVKHQTLLKM